jgi:hypothetical protein
MSEETVTFNLELNTEQTFSEIRKLETLLFRSLALARRLGLPEDINEAINRIQRMVMTIRLLHTAMIALEAATGPIGWALAIVGGVSAVVSMGDFMMETR